MAVERPGPSVASEMMLFVAGAVVGMVATMLVLLVWSVLVDRAAARQYERNRLIRSTEQRRRLG